jgi:uncharacterized membrane protein YphA (DoxX/SURF4 family)
VEMYDFVLQGANAPEAALTLNRVALGTFFAISGYHKLFNASRHTVLVRTIEEDGVHGIALMQWVLPAGEFLGGSALVAGLLSVLAALALFVICSGAVLLVAEAHPSVATDRSGRLARRSSLRSGVSVLHRARGRDLGGTRPLERRRQNSVLNGGRFRIRIGAAPGGG